MGNSKKRLSDLLFVDIETAGMVSDYKKLPVELKDLWQIKARQISKNKELTTKEGAQLFSEKAGIFSEFARVVCISVGYFTFTKSKISGFRCKSFCGEDEAQILKQFAGLLKKHFNKPNKQGLCGHNIKEFDIPFLCRRFTILGMKVPKLLDISGKKPWQVEHLVDTLVLWRFGDYKNYTSLALLAAVLKIPTPKDDIDGSDIHSVYWEQEDIRRIVTYCEKDVLTVAKVFLRIKNAKLPKDFVVSSQTTFDDDIL